MKKSALAITALIGLLVAHQVSAKECWALTDLKGQLATSPDKYQFRADKFSNPMVLCFNDDETGTVSGDDTAFRLFGKSTLIGWVQNGGLELVETYQIDRVSGKVLFTKTRIGTATAFPGFPDVIGAFVGTAVELRK